MPAEAGIQVVGRWGAGEGAPWASGRVLRPYELDPGLRRGDRWVGEGLRPISNPVMPAEAGIQFVGLWASGGALIGLQEPRPSLG